MNGDTYTTTGPFRAALAGEHNVRGVINDADGQLTAMVSGVYAGDPVIADRAATLKLAQQMAAGPELLRLCIAQRHLIQCMATGPGWTQELVDEAEGAAVATLYLAGEVTLP